MGKTENLNEVNELRQDYEEEYGKNNVPSYLEEYLDQEEKRHLDNEFFANITRNKYARRSTPIEEREKIKKENEENYWSANVARLRKIRKKHSNPIFKESAKAAERVEQEKYLDPKERIVLKNICAKDLYLFAVRYFPHYLKKPSSELHKFIYHRLTNGITRRKVKGFKLAIAAPRTGAKSSLISTIFPIWCVCYNYKKFIILISDTTGQSSDFLADIKKEFEFNEKLKADFPEACGQGPTWRVDEIITNNEVKISALGTGSKVRGRRFGIHRPDLFLCHEEGTKILYDGRWINIEDFPNSLERISDGFEIFVHGLPFPEVITDEHRYWTKTFKRKIKNSEIFTGWKEAKNLNFKYWREKDYIGYPIDYSIEGPEPIDVYYPIITERSSDGKILKSESSFALEQQEEFYDPDFWWFVGLWWGGGYSSGKYIIDITVANKDIEVFNKLKHVLNKYNISFATYKRKGCFQVIFFWSKFARWLKSWRTGNSIKTPPYWVEKLDFKYQKELIKGYIAADGFIDYKNQQVRLTSVNFDGLLSVKRILARLNIPSSIHKGIGPKKFIIDGRECKSQRKYDLRFRENAYLLGYNISNQSRYNLQRVFIEDGYVWHKVKDKKRVHNRKFIPIKTKDSTYITNFGLSHNCDDIENNEMVRSKTMRENIRYDWFDKEVMFAGAEESGKDEDMLVTDFLVIGTILSSHSLLNSLFDTTEYPEWESHKFSAIKKFPVNMELWDKWYEIYSNKLNINRHEDAWNFFLENREEMEKGAELLWPEGDPLYGLMVTRYAKPPAFYNEKQNNPLDPTRILVPFDKLTFKSFSRDPEIRRILQRKSTMVIGAHDPSLGKKQSADPSCLVTIARDKETGLIFVRDINMRRRSVDQQIEDIFNVYETYQHKLIAIEENGFQVVLKDNLLKESRKRGYYVPVEPVKNYSDKEMRIESIVPLLLDGTIIFDLDKYHNNRQYVWGIEQLTTYMRGIEQEDDFPDALQMCVSQCRRKRFKMIVKENR